MTELHDLTALEQASLIARGEVSSVELTEHYLARSETAGREVGAFVRLLGDQALAAAREVDEQRRREPVDAPHRRLAGVVCPIKDLEIIAGVPCSLGNPALTVTLPRDSNVVAALRRGGLVFTGTTTTPEFGLPCYTEPDDFPTARTPWDLSRSAAGSSGGAAAAVAAGCAPLAQGSDGGGSVRLPASACGLVGLKPSRGRVSTGPYVYAAGELATAGPLARTVRDAAALLDVMVTSPAYGDPFSPPALPTGSFLSTAEAPPRRLRIGWFTAPVVGVTPPSAAVLTAVSDTVELLVELGHEVVPIEPPLTHESVGLFEMLWAALAAAVEVPAEVEAALTPLTRYLRDQAQRHTAADLARAVAGIRARGRAALEATEGFDAVLCPTAADVPFEVGSLRNDADPAADFEAQKQWAAYTALYNVTGQPSINLPLNWTADGLPVGVQFAARRDDEMTLLTLSAQLEEARPWLERRPSVW